MSLELSDKIKFEVEKISPVSGDAIVIKFPAEMYEEVNADVLTQLMNDVNNGFPGFSFIAASDEVEFERLSEDQLKHLGLRLIDKE